MIGHKVRARGKQRLKSILSSRVLMTTILGIVVLATLLSLSDFKTVWQIIQGFPPHIIPVLFVLVAVRELFRSVEWRVFLNAIGIHASHREAFLALAGGDAAQVVPGGLYLQDLLVSRELNTPVSAPLAATTVMVWMEVTVAMLTLGMFGLPDLLELRVVMAFCGLGSLAVLLVMRASLLERVRNYIRRWGAQPGGEIISWQHRLVHQTTAVLDDFIGAYEALERPKVIVTGLLLCAAYMTLTYYGFYLVCANLHLPGIGIAQAAAVYSLVLAIVIVNPLPSDLGISELSGVGAFLAFHVNPADGLAAMLTFRVLLLLGEELVAAIAFLTFRRETQRLFQPAGAPAPAAENDGGPPVGEVSADGEVSL